MKIKRIWLILFITLVTLLSVIYFRFWTYRANQINDYLNSLSNKQLFLPKELFLTIDEKAFEENKFSTKSTEDMMNFFSKSAHKELLAVLKEMQLYNFSFTKSSYQGFPFKIEFLLDGIIENNSESELTYNQPLTIGYNIITGNIYIDFKGNIIQNFHPKDNNIKRLVTIDARVETYLSIFSLLKEDPFSLVQKINNIKLTAANFIIKDYNTQEILFSISDLVHELGFTHSYNYENFKDLFINAPKTFTAISKYNIQKSYDLKNSYAISIINFLTGDESEAEYKKKFQYTTGAPDWSNLAKVFSNSSIVDESEMKSYNNKNTYVYKSEVSILNPEPDKYFYKISATTDQKFDLLGLKNASNKAIEEYKKALPSSIKQSTILEEVLKLNFAKFKDEDNYLNIKINANASINSEEVKVAIPDFLITLNDANINFTNESMLNKVMASSGGYLGFKNPIFASQIFGNISSLFMSLEKSEVTILQNAIYKTLNNVFNDVKSNKDEIGNQYKITIVSQNIGNFSFGEIKVLFFENLRKEAEIILGSSEVEIFLKKF